MNLIISSIIAVIIGGICFVRGSEYTFSAIVALCAAVVLAIIAALKFKNQTKHLHEKNESIQTMLDKANSELSKNTYDSKSDELKALEAEIFRKRCDLTELNDELLYQSFGLYEPKYSFSTVDGYKERLAKVRADQKYMIKNGTACNTSYEVTYNESISEGKKVVKDWTKLMLRAFNGECDTIISKAKFNNMEQLDTRIRKAAIEISDIGYRMRISISKQYALLKLDELHIAYEYEMFKQNEKERLQAIREEEREKAKLEKELQERRSKIIKDQKHVEAELEDLNKRLGSASGPDASAIMDRISELKEYASKLERDLEEVDFRAQQARAGYVYIISNIGAFGEDVYKIGLTRRLNPQERVDELGDASVPFKFDVHAMIFSEDAVTLETALHHEFDNRRVNLVNSRKEFFRVSLDEIEAVVKSNYSEVVEFTRLAAAKEYRESEMIRRVHKSA